MSDEPRDDRHDDPDGEPRRMTPSLTPELVELIDNPPEFTRMSMWVIRMGRQLYRDLALLAEQNAETLQHSYRLLRRVLTVVFVVIGLVFAIEVATGVATLDLIRSHSHDAARLKHAVQQSQYQTRLRECQRGNRRYARSTGLVTLLKRIQSPGKPPARLVAQLLKVEGIKPTPKKVAIVQKIETVPRSPLLRAQLDQSQAQLNTLINFLTTKTDDCRKYAASQVVK